MREKVLSFFSSWPNGLLYAMQCVVKNKNLWERRTVNCWWKSCSFYGYIQVCMWVYVCSAMLEADDIGWATTAACIESLASTYTREQIGDRVFLARLVYAWHRHTPYASSSSYWNVFFFLFLFVFHFVLLFFTFSLFGRNILTTGATVLSCCWFGLPKWII